MLIGGFVQIYTCNDTSKLVWTLKSKHRVRIFDLRVLSGFSEFWNLDRRRLAMGRNLELIPIMFHYVVLTPVPGSSRSQLESHLLYIHKISVPGSAKVT